MQRVTPHNTIQPNPHIVSLRILHLTIKGPVVITYNQWYTDSSFDMVNMDIGYQVAVWPATVWGICKFEVDALVAGLNMWAREYTLLSHAYPTIPREKLGMILSCALTWVNVVINIRVTLQSIYSLMGLRQHKYGFLWLNQTWQHLYNDSIVETKQIWHRMVSDSYLRHDLVCS